MTPWICSCNFPRILKPIPWDRMVIDLQLPVGDFPSILKPIAMQLSFSKHVKAYSLRQEGHCSAAACRWFSKHFAAHSFGQKGRCSVAASRRFSKHLPFSLFWDWLHIYDKERHVGRSNYLLLYIIAVSSVSHNNGKSSSNITKYIINCWSLSTFEVYSLINTLTRLKVKYYRSLKLINN